MPIRFRRTLKIAPGVKLNFSKSGVSTTVGPKGFHFTFGKRGVRRTVSIPGTGVSEVDYIDKKHKEGAEEKKEKAASRKETAAEQREEKKESRAGHPIPATGVAARRRAANAGSTGLRNFFVLLALVVFFFIGAAMLGLMPAHFFSNALAYLAHLVQSTGH